MVGAAEFLIGVALSGTLIVSGVTTDSGDPYRHISQSQGVDRPSPAPVNAQATDSPSTAALRFFATLPPGEVGAALRAIRPPSIPAERRARILARLPEDGELIPDAAERRKIAALEPVLVYHERHEVFSIKVIDLRQAGIVIHERTVLLVSRLALRLLSAAELQAAVAHEMGHEYFWSEYEDTRLARDAAGRQALELKCDGIAALTLLALGLDVSRLGSGMRKLIDFNEELGATADTRGYPTVRERQDFVRTLLKTFAGRHRQIARARALSSHSPLWPPEEDHFSVGTSCRSSSNQLRTTVNLPRSRASMSSTTSLSMMKRRPSREMSKFLFLAPSAKYSPVIVNKTFGVPATKRPPVVCTGTAIIAWPLS